MKSWNVFLLCMFAVATALQEGAGLPGFKADTLSGSSEEKRTPVIVELFTSEGCSSCPPADEVLSRLEQAQPVRGAQVIALGQHVDYWNQLGWADPYSSAEFSARQSEYAESFGSGRIYTPQMVVDGQTEFVGSSLSRAQDAIARAARSPKAAIELALERAQPGTGLNAFPLRVRVANFPALSAGDSAEVFLAITEGGLYSNVSRGENAGRRLSHSAVVRKLDRIGKITSQAGQTFASDATIRVERGWRLESLRAVVFVQERASRRILGAAATVLVVPE